MITAVRVLLASVVCIAAWPGLSQASDDDKPKSDATGSMSDIFGGYGFSEDKTSQFQKSGCKISYNLDQQKFVEKVPDLQKIGLLNPDLTQTKINMMPNSITFAFIVEILPIAVKSAYESHLDIDHCQFSQFITRVDDYGNNRRDSAMTFSFSRDLYKKINWDNFQAQKLPKIAPGFRFSPSFMETVAAEAAK